VGILEDEALEEHLRSYQEGYEDGYKRGWNERAESDRLKRGTRGRLFPGERGTIVEEVLRGKKRKLSAWNKFVKANAKKPRFIFRNGKLNLKKMGVAFRKTPAGKKVKR